MHILLIEGSQLNLTTYLFFLLCGVIVHFILSISQGVTSTFAFLGGQPTKNRKKKGEGWCKTHFRLDYGFLLSLYLAKDKERGETAKCT